ncbi:MAG: hypothetical protein H6Q86_3915, partial [candidate division NC10 bacterium]|nr:hypothetical protein [candidate division NC10 bacterium]
MVSARPVLRTPLYPNNPFPPTIRPRQFGLP